MKVWSNSWRRAGAAVWVIMLVAALGWVIWRFGDQIGLAENHHKLLVFLLIIAIAMGGVLAPRWLAHLKRQNHREQGRVGKVYPPADSQIVLPHSPTTHLLEVREHLREHYGLFWRHKTRLLLIIGEPTEIEAIAPTLAAHQWLEGQGTVLLWGGSAQAALDQSFPERWRGLSRWRALDGVVWALNETQAADDVAMGKGVRQVQRLARDLRWQLPLSLWQVCGSAWAQDTRKAQPVGCQLPERFSAAALDAALNRLLEPLRRAGLAQMNAVMKDDFLLRLSRDLKGEGIDRWRHTLAHLAGEFARGVPLRGGVVQPAGTALAA